MLRERKFVFGFSGLKMLTFPLKKSWLGFVYVGVCFYRCAGSHACVRLLCVHHVCTFVCVCVCVWGGGGGAWFTLLYLYGYLFGQLYQHKVPFYDDKKPISLSCSPPPPPSTGQVLFKWTSQASAHQELTTRSMWKDMTAQVGSLCQWCKSLEFNVISSRTQLETWPTVFIQFVLMDRLQQAQGHSPFRKCPFLLVCQQINPFRCDRSNSNDSD